MATKDDLVALLAATEAAQQARVPWWQVARAAARLGSAAALLTEPWEPSDRWEQEVAAALAHDLRPDAQTHWSEELERWQASDERLRFMTILDQEYPASLRLVFNPPPFLTLRGELAAEDARGVAVVGTRRPSEECIRRAGRLSRELAEAGITVYSGLAAGVDSAAHAGALDGGGRTVAVLGHGLLRPIYPKENAPLAGTIVVEASGTSGSRMQARLAAEQGKQVWLLRSLVDEFDWAREFAERRPSEVRVVERTDDILEQVVDAQAIAEQAANGLPPVAFAEERRRGEPAEPQFALFE